MEKSAYDALLAEASVKFPGTCKFYLLSKCGHGEQCRNGKHKRPDGLGAWVAEKQGLSM